MPSYKDKNNGTWYCKFYYDDPRTGEKKQKLKRGFNLQREAEAYERNFLVNLSYSPSMPFSEFYEQYRKDVDPKLREHTILTRSYQMKRIMPVFGDMPLDEIKPIHISQWHNDLIADGLSKRYMDNLHACLSAVFNHAVRFYDLKNNPCQQVGRPVAPDAKKKAMRFWTYEEFSKVDQALADDNYLKERTLLNVLYWSGIRKGELLALTWGDLDQEAKTLSITKSYQRLKGKAVITPTKTGIKRTILMPDKVLQLLNMYSSTCYDTSKNAHIFPYERRLIEDAIKLGAELTGVERIHVHGLRHSHASLLIQLDVNIVLISKRLGHEKVSTTLDTYSHFFPDDELKAVNKMNDLASDTKMILINERDKQNKNNEG